MTALHEVLVTFIGPGQAWVIARLDIADDLRGALYGEDLHKIEAWTARHGVAIAEWPAEPVDPFFNVNTPADVAEEERLAAGPFED